MSSKKKTQPKQMDSTEEKQEKLISIQEYVDLNGYPKFAKIAVLKLYSKGEKKAAKTWEKELIDFNKFKNN